MKNDNSRTDDYQDFSTRDRLLRANSELIYNLQKRINVKRFRVQEGDSIKLGYIRALIQALQVQNAILKDAELDKLRAEVQELKEAIKSQSQH
jgi:phosphatidylinositol kinase/protein kinase (PI-3  family)